MAESFLSFHKGRRPLIFTPLYLNDDPRTEIIGERPPMCPILLPAAAPRKRHLATKPHHRGGVALWRVYATLQGMTVRKCHKLRDKAFSRRGRVLAQRRRPSV